MSASAHVSELLMSAAAVLAGLSALASAPQQQHTGNAARQDNGDNPLDACFSIVVYTRS